MSWKESIISGIIMFMPFTAATNMSQTARWKKSERLSA